MKRILVLLLVALVLGGCSVDPGPPIPPIPPTPPTPPVPPEPPPPSVTPIPASTFDGVVVGQVWNPPPDFPPFERKVNVANRTILTWVLDEERDTAGYKRWEVHIEAGIVIASFKY